MEIEEALQQHIRSAVSKGASVSDLKKRLISAGWPKDLIESFIRETEPAYQGPALIKLKGVSKSFGSNKIIENLDLEIPPGELFGIIGLSGAGKTTLLNLMVGFVEQDTGDILLKLPDNSETSVFKSPEIVKNMFGFATQTPSFYDRLTVRENIEHFASLYNIRPEKIPGHCRALLKLVGLEDSQHTVSKNLSGGMQKRLDIACAIVHEPDVLILDEPTADLDSLIRSQIWKLIKQINRHGTTVIVASHVVSELERNCSRIAILRNHRITEVGTPQKLKNIYSTNYEVFVETSRKSYDKIQKLLSKNKKLFPSIRKKGSRLVLQTARPRKAISEILSAAAKAKDRIIHLNLSRPSISEVFASLVKK